MVDKSISIIDYGIGNLLSVRKALETCGATVQVVKTPEEIINSSRIVLPGVGAFGNCVNELRHRQLEEPILQFIKTGNPILGICVGMQILQEWGEEFGLHKGLGVISGRVIKIPTVDQDGSRKIPFIGWANLINRKEPFHKIFQDIDETAFFYFVHSFKVETSNPFHTIAYYEYMGILIAALIKKENIYGCQFHPEKSGEVGLTMLKNFIAL